MKKRTAALLLTTAFITLLLTISYTKNWLDTLNIPTGGNCVFSAQAQKDPATRRVCLGGGCILYSEWVKMSDEEKRRAKIELKG